MAGKPVEFHPEAIAEAEAAVDWYLHRSRRAAEGFILELERAVDAITKGPERWPIFQGNFRRHPLRRFPFLIISRQLSNSNQVIAVAHGRRRPGYWQSRSAK